MRLTVFPQPALGLLDDHDFSNCSSLASRVAPPCAVGHRAKQPITLAGKLGAAQAT